MRNSKLSTLTVSISIGVGCLEFNFNNHNSTVPLIKGITNKEHAFVSDFFLGKVVTK